MGSSISSNTSATYSASLSYVDYDNSKVFNQLDSRTIAPGAVTSFDTVLSSTWAQATLTEFVIAVTSSDNSLWWEKSFYVVIEPAFRTATFDQNVATDDGNQPAVLPKSAIQVTYGKPFSYNPASNDGSAQSLPTPTRPNYDFAGWYTNYNASTGTYSNLVTDGTVFTGTQDVTLYAKWVGKEYTVRLDGYDYKGEKRGVLTPNTVTVTYGETYEALASVTGEGKTGDNVELRGFTSKNGAVIKPQDTVDSSLYDWKTGPLTLYPVWGTARESIEDAVVEDLAESYGYTGKEVVPEVIVKIPESKDAEGNTLPEKVLAEGKDYSVTCENNVELSINDLTARLTIEGKGTYKGSVSKSFRIVAGEPYLKINGQAQNSASDEPFVLSFTGSGSTVIAAELVTDATSGVNYSLVFADDATAEKLEDYASIDSRTGIITVKKPLGTLKLRVTANAPFGTKYLATPAEGTSCLLMVRSTSLSECSVSLAATKYTYSGKAKTPGVTVKSPAGTTLAAGTDYTVKYPSSRKAVGTYKVTVTGIGGYAGSVTKSFTINPKGCSKLKASRTSITKKQGGKTYPVYKLSWNKVAGIDGYQVKRTITKSATSSFKPSVTSAYYGWEKRKTVKVQIRTYKNASGKKYYSDWKTISVKVK